MTNNNRRNLYNKKQQTNWSNFFNYFVSKFQSICVHSQNLIIQSKKKSFSLFYQKKSQSFWRFRNWFANAQTSLQSFYQFRKIRQLNLQNQFQQSKICQLNLQNRFHEINDLQFQIFVLFSFFSMRKKLNQFHQQNLWLNYSLSKIY